VQRRFAVPEEHTAGEYQRLGDVPNEVTDCAGNGKNLWIAGFV